MPECDCGIGMVLFLARMRRVVGAQDIGDAVGDARPDARRDAPCRAPAGSSAHRCRAAYRPSRPASGDAASPRRWPRPCGRPGRPSRRRSRYAAHGCACRSCAPAPTSRVVQLIATSGERQTGWLDGSPGTRRCLRSSQHIFVFGVEGGAPRDRAQDGLDAVIVRAPAASRWTSP